MSARPRPARAEQRQPALSAMGDEGRRLTAGRLQGKRRLRPRTPAGTTPAAPPRSLARWATALPASPVRTWRRSGSSLINASVHPSSPTPTCGTVATCGNGARRACSRYTSGAQRTVVACSPHLDKAIAADDTWRDAWLVCTPVLPRRAGLLRKGAVRQGGRAVPRALEEHLRVWFIFIFILFVLREEHLRRLPSDTSSTLRRQRSHTHLPLCAVSSRAAPEGRRLPRRRRRRACEPRLTLQRPQLRPAGAAAYIALLAL